MLKRRVTKAVIPAAGLGTRFLPATKAQPKEMLPIVDKPTLQYIVEEAKAAGITDILIINGRNKESIVNHFDYSVELEQQLEKSGKQEAINMIREISDGINIFYVRQKEAKGLGHAVSCAKSFAGNEPFAVLLGDDVIVSETPTIGQMIELYEEKQSTILGLMEVSDSEVQKYGIIDGEKLNDHTFKINNMVEKPALEDAPSNFAIIGRYIINPEIFEILENTKPGKNNEIQLTDALLSLSKQEDIYGYCFDGKRYDIGSKLGYVKANLEFGLRDKTIGDKLKEYLKELNLDEF